MRARAAASERPCSSSIPNRRRNLASSRSDWFSVSWDFPRVDCCTTVLVVYWGAGAGDLGRTCPPLGKLRHGRLDWSFSTNLRGSVSRLFRAFSRLKAPSKNAPRGEMGRRLANQGRGSKKPYTVGKVVRTPQRRARTSGERRALGSGECVRARGNDHFVRERAVSATATRHAMAHSIRNAR